MSDEPASSLRKFLLLALVLGAMAGGSWWLLEGPGRLMLPKLFKEGAPEAAAKPDAAAKFLSGGHFWFTPDDFLGQGAKVAAGEAREEAPATEPGPVEAPPPPAAPATSPSIKVTRTTAGPTIGAHTILADVRPGLTLPESMIVPSPPELNAFDEMVGRKLREIWVPPAAEEVPAGADLVEMLFTIGRNGAVLKSQEMKMSGNNAMDRSVLYAGALFINAGLPVPAAHVGDEYEVSVEFRLRR